MAFQVGGTASTAGLAPVLEQRFATGVIFQKTINVLLCNNSYVLFRVLNTIPSNQPIEKAEVCSFKLRM